MEKSKKFFILSISFIVGIGTASFYYPRTISNSVILSLFIFALIGIFVFYQERNILFFETVVAVFIFGIFLTNLKLNNLKNLDWDGKYFSGEVLIVKEPEVKDKKQKIIIQPIVRTSNVHNRHLMSMKFLLNTNIYQEYDYGDELKIDCGLEKIENFDESFDYQMYLAKEGIFYQCKNPKIEKLNRNSGNKIYLGLLKIKNKFNENINQLIPVPESGLLSGLILGGSNQLSEDMKNNFSRTGMTHIVAVSGYNVTIIAEYLMIAGIFLGLWRRQAFWFAVTGIIIFVIVTGLSSSAVRAGIMGILLIWAMKNGRLANSQNAILFSAVLMLLINPLLLRFDVGFQLSFLATLGIIYLYPIVENYLVKNNKVFGIAEILFLTLSAQIFVLPVILFNFQKLSLISPLANILILPIIPLTMLLGFICAMTSFIFQPLAIIFSWLTYLPLKYETLTINYLASLRYASVEVWLTWWGVVIGYIILIALVYFLKKKIEKEII